MQMRTGIEIKNLVSSILCVVMLFVTAPVLSADNPCEDENNIVNPALALCSTHVYNIYATENPSDGADKEMMKEVVALKTTVMTQQMYKQYEYLESMMKRFKTQLEKAVLTTKLQAAGAGTDGNSSSSSSSNSGSSAKNNDSGVKLDGAQNCAQTSYQDAHTCLMSNIQLVINAVNDRKNMNEAQRQLKNDLGVASTWGIICTKSGQYDTCKDSNGTRTFSGDGALAECNRISSSNIIQCAQKFNAAVSRAQYEMQQQQNRYKNPYI